MSAFQAGQNVTFVGEDGLPHPATIVHACCDPPLYWIADEFGWDRGLTADQMTPRDTGPTFAFRPPGPRATPARMARRTRRPGKRCDDPQ